MPSNPALGGIFLRAADPKALYAWYAEHLGLAQSNGAWRFPTPAASAGTIFSLFKKDDAYFPTTQPVMLNLQVEDLEALLARLAAVGVPIDPDRQSYDFGHFAWITDPEGNRIELWQPTD